MRHADWLGWKDPPIEDPSPNFRTLSVDPQLIGTELMSILVFGHYKWTAGLLILRSGSFTPKVW